LFENSDALHHILQFELEIVFLRAFFGQTLITRNGHPYALLLKINDEELEDFILAKHFDLENEFNTAKQEWLSHKTKNVHDLLNEI